MRVRPSQHLVSEQLITDRRSCAEARQEFGDQRVAVAAARTSDDTRRDSGPAPRQRIELGHHFRDRVVPRDRLVATFSAIARALQRLRDAIGVIGHLNRRLTARAQAAAIDRVVRVSFQLLRSQDLHDAGLAVANDVGVGVHHAHGQPAPGRTQRADTRLPHGLPRHDVFVRNEANELMIRIAAAGEGGGGAGDGGELDEGSAVHQSPARSDTSDSRPAPCARCGSSRRSPCPDRRCAAATVPSCDGAVARRALDLGADVRRVIEADVRLRRVVEHALPDEVLAAVAHRRDLLDARPIRRRSCCGRPCTSGRSAGRPPDRWSPPRGSTRCSRSSCRA